MTISLPEDMKAFIEQRIKGGSYSSVSEFIRQLVREEQKRAEQEKLERMLIEGIESGPPIRANDKYWDDLRKRVEARVAARKPNGSRK
jgi:antitoxin ParD1/3/4